MYNDLEDAVMWITYWQMHRTYNNTSSINENPDFIDCYYSYFVQI